ncbi:fibronectin type III domain protein [Candidatus Vecturithrix granuli]|uniref:Fibronectin type III domain protein n=1 Tax=Vecturithrix granuli TaxID=1499967 RepID=A0A081CAI4_VECG1|nr:fibronectin type III domain protein [Candidatus Vecturithrix granuli]
MKNYSSMLQKCVNVFSIVIIFLISVLNATMVMAAPPDNDNLADAITMTANESVLQSTAEATQEASEGLGTCGYNATASVWYKFTPTITDNLSINTVGSGFDTVLSVWTGTGTHPLTQVACNDDILPGTIYQSQVSIPATSGTTYYIRIAGHNGTTGDLELYLSMQRLVTLNLSGSPMAEEGETATVTATLSGTSSQDVTVTLGFTGTAIYGSDYTSTGTQIIISAGNLSGSVTLTGLTDNIYEVNETIIVDIIDVKNGVEDGVQQQTATLTSEDLKPTVILGLTGSPMNEGGSATVTATLSNPSYLAITVNLGFTGSATNGTDYNTPPTSIEIAAETLSNSITLTSVNDDLYEGVVAETIIVDITGVTNATESGTQKVTAEITENDPKPTVTLALDKSSINEIGEVATVTAALSNPSIYLVTVNLAFTGTATSGGTDYTASGTSIPIAAGTLSNAITLTSVHDELYEGENETIIVTINAVTNGSAGDPNTVTAMITDDDTQPTVTLTLTNSPLAEAGGVATVTATLSNPSVDTVTVALGFSGRAVGSGTDYTASGNNILIPAGALNNTITLTGVDDALYEVDDTLGHETIIVDIVGVTNATEKDGLQQVTATITDDDARPTVTLGLTGSPFAEDGGDATVTATLSAEAGIPVTVNLGFTGTAISGTDYNAPPTSIEIAVGTLSESFTLTGKPDELYEVDDTLGDEIIIVEIDTVTNATEDGEQRVTARITDDDDRPTVTLAVDPATFNETGGTTTVTATLSAVAGIPVTVNFGFSGTATSGTDYTAGTSIVIPAGEPSATLTITSEHDTQYEPDETIVVDIASVTNADEDGEQRVTATITDDDNQPTVTLSVTGSPMAEDGGVATVTATLSNLSVEDVTVTLSFSGGAIGFGVDYTHSGSAILITAGNPTGSITITGKNDVFYEGPEDILVDIIGVTNGTENGDQQVIAIITDAETPPKVVLTLTGSPLAENGGVATVTAFLTNLSVQDVTVTLGFSGTATGGGTDYTASGTSLIIAAMNVTNSITLTGVNDALIEDDETIVVDITGVTNGTESGMQQVTATITDNDPEIDSNSYLLWTK